MTDVPRMMQVLAAVESRIDQLPETVRQWAGGRGRIHMAVCQAVLCDRQVLRRRVPVEHRTIASLDAVQMRRELFDQQFPQTADRLRRISGTNSFLSRFKRILRHGAGRCGLLCRPYCCSRRSPDASHQPGDGLEISDRSNLRIRMTSSATRVTSKPNSFPIQANVRRL